VARLDAVTARRAAVVALLLALFAVAATAAEPDVVMRFSPSLVEGGSPPGWEPVTFRRIERHTRYTVIAEGDGHALRAESDRAASGLSWPLDLDARVYRRLEWRWKIERVLDRADARTRAGDDYPARVYVAFRFDPERATAWERLRYGAIKVIYGRYPPKHVINYVWDNRLPPGTMLDNAYTDRAKMIVVQSGAARAGAWVGESRDVYDDYRRLFDAEPPAIVGVAVMTDTDDTGERAVAYYGTLALRRAP
jgi:hypothetical protein